MRTAVNTQGGILPPNIDENVLPNTAPSTDPAKELQSKYPPTMQMIVINGPTPAKENCASPPVRFGINAFNSATDKSVKILTTHAIAIVIIKEIPIPPAPIPRDNKQLLATTSPTPVAMTLPSPIFFSPIEPSP